MMRALLVIVFVAFAHPAISQEPANPPPPASLDDQGISTWIGQYLETDGWVVIGADEIAVALIQNEPIRRTPEGMPVVQVRHEYYEPSDFGGRISRSNLQLRIFNCEAASQQVNTMIIFEHNNMRQNLGLHQFTNAEWTNGAPGSLKARTIATVCALADQRTLD